MSDINKDLLRYNPRDEQQKAHDFIFKIKSENKDMKFFLLNLPTGSGKSHISLMLANTFINTLDKDAKIDVITASKLLQDQYSEVYKSINNLKGKDNYNCKQYQCSCLQGMEFNKLNKTECSFCPYDSARKSFVGGKLSLTNFYLYLIYAIELIMSDSVEIVFNDSTISISPLSHTSLLFFRFLHHRCKLLHHFS